MNNKFKLSTLEFLDGNYHLKFKLRLNRRRVGQIYSRADNLNRA